MNGNKYVYDVAYTSEEVRDAARLSFEARGRECNVISYSDRPDLWGLRVERKWAIGMAAIYHNEIQNLLEQAYSWVGVTLETA